VVGGFSSLGCEFVFLRDASCCQPLPWRLRNPRKEPMSDQPDPARPQDEAPADAKPRSSISRREFARRAALASAVASIAPAAAVAAPLGASHSITQDPPPPALPAASAQSAMPNAPKLSVESQSEADARFQAILVLYGSRFSAEQKNDLHRLCAVVQPSLDHIRAFKIENGDGPALYLKPQYEREKKPKPPVVAPAKSPTGQSASPAKSAPAASAPKKP
jgi:hypothetical protein